MGITETVTVSMPKPNPKLNWLKALNNLEIISILSQLSQWSDFHTTICMMRSKPLWLLHSTHTHTHTRTHSHTHTLTHKHKLTHTRAHTHTQRKLTDAPWFVCSSTHLLQSHFASFCFNEFLFEFLLIVLARPASITIVKVDWEKTFQHSRQYSNKHLNTEIIDTVDL